MIGVAYGQNKTSRCVVGRSSKDGMTCPSEHIDNGIWKDVLIVARKANFHDCFLRRYYGR
jgi:hypothetical protein